MSNFIIRGTKPGSEREGLHKTLVRERAYTNAGSDRGLTQKPGQREGLHKALVRERA